MPEEPTNPSEEPVHLLIELVRAATTQKGKGQVGEGSSSSNLVVYLIIVGLAVLVFSFMGFLMVRARRKAAQMAYDLRKKEEDKARAEEDIRLSKTSVERENADKTISALDVEIVRLKKELEDQKELSEKRKKVLVEATSWEDLGL